jgi:hypothetical protein
MTTDTGRERGDRAPGFHLDEDLCLDLLHGLLDADARERALDHMAACPACDRLFQLRAAALERLRARPVPVAVAPSATTAALPGGWRVILGRPVARGLAAGLVAASVALLLLLGPGVRRDPVVQPLPWLPEIGRSIQARSPLAGAASAELSAGLEAYAAHDAGGAVRLLRRAKASGSLETVRRIYLGSALALDGRYEESVEVLRDTATPDLPDPWGSEVRWTLFVALRSAGYTTAADSLWQVLRREPGEVGERARRLAPN